jgi:hypothetical protein
VNDDLHDPRIASMLGRASGAYPDANVAFVAVTGRVHQARRRRAFAASSAACAMIIGVAAVATQAGGSGSQLTPAGSFTTIDSDTEVSTTDLVTTEASTSDSVDDSSSSVETTTAETATSVDDEGSSGAGGTTATGGTTGNSSGGSSGSAPKPTVPAGPQVQDSEGGSLAFSNDGGTLTFVTATPAAGFAEDTDARVVEAHRLRVEFTDGTTTWRIEVRTEGGKMPIEVTHHG